MRTLIILLSGCNFVIGMGAFVVIGMIGPMATDLATSTAATGSILTVYALCYAVLSPLLASATGGIGRRHVLTLGMGLFASGMALSAIAPGLGTLYLARVLAAAGAGLFTPVGAAVVANLAAPEIRGRALAALFFGLTLAQVIGIPAGSWIAYTYGWRIAFWVVFALAAVSLPLIWRHVPQGLSFQSAALSDLLRVLRNGQAVFAILFTASFLAATYVPYTYLTPLLQDRLGFGRDGIALALAAFGVGAVFGNLAGGWMADRLGAVRTLVILSLGQIVAMPLLSALPFPTALVIGLIFVWSMLGWSFLAAQQVRLLAIAPESATVVLSLNAAAIYIGAAVGSAIGGLVVSQIGVGMTGLVGGSMALIALGHILWSHRQIMLSAR